MAVYFSQSCSSLSQREKIIMLNSVTFLFRIVVYSNATFTNKHKTGQAITLFQTIHFFYSYGMKAESKLGSSDNET